MGQPSPGECRSRFSAGFEAALSFILSPVRWFELIQRRWQSRWAPGGSPSPTLQALEGSASQDGQELAQDSEPVGAEPDRNFSDLKHTAVTSSLESMKHCKTFRDTCKS